MALLPSHQIYSNGTVLPVPMSSPPAQAQLVSMSALSLPTIHNYVTPSKLANCLVHLLHVEHNELKPTLLSNNL